MMWHLFCFVWKYIVVGTSALIWRITIVFKVSIAWYLLSPCWLRLLLYALLIQLQWVFITLGMSNDIVSMCFIVIEVAILIVNALIIIAGVEHLIWHRLLCTTHPQATHPTHRHPFPKKITFLPMHCNGSNKSNAGFRPHTAQITLTHINAGPWPPGG